MSKHEALSKHAKALNWGNSVAVRIPKAFLVATGIKAGMGLEITNTDQGLLIKPLQKEWSPIFENPYSLEAMLQTIDEHTAHKDELSQPPAGELAHN
jgi:antitoxin component of MazEF toxin-antitoxin module